ncbi:MAG: aldo/keto reductase [Sedimentisphaerales bacterium]|nr:aldo/keto reductase [Sedimentisphaerales bacterium]
MIYRTYGSTDIKVSAIGFGGMRFEELDDVDTCAALVKAAYDKGVNYFDTAPGYNKSEESFGIAFKHMNKTRSHKPFYVSTKSSKSESTEIRRDIETSLKKMNLDYIDFYHCWCIITFDVYQTRKAKGVLDEFEKLKAEGLVRHICVSTHMTGTDIEKMLQDYPFEGVLLGYSAMNFAYREAALDAAERLNRTVVVMNPLGGGVIPQHPNRFGFLKTHQGETVVKGALRFLINDPRITVTLVGLSNQRQLHEAISAVEGFQPIRPETIQKIRSSLQKSFSELCTCCQYCDNCPQGIPIPKLMDAYNFHMLNSKPVDMINRLRFHWGIELQDDCLRKCTECGLCEETCTQKLPIRERLKFISKEVDKFLAAGRS